MLILFCLVFGSIGAVLGWWKDTRQLYRRPGSKWSTDIVPKDRIHPSVLWRRRRRRFVTTAAFGLYGMLFAAGFFWSLQAFVK